MAQPLRDIEEAEPDRRGRDHHAYGSQHDHGPALAAHAREVDVQGAGEQQQTEQAVEYHVGEIDLGHELAGLRDHFRMVEAKDGHAQAGHQPDGGDAQGVGQLDEAMVDDAKNGDEGKRAPVP